MPGPISEEDVLAALVLDLALLEEDCSLGWWGVPNSLPAIVGARYAEQGYKHSQFISERFMVAAIADSERRLDVERAREAVVAAAGVYFDGSDLDNSDEQLLRAVARLRALEGEP